MDDDELLSLVAQERRQSIGFNHDEELNAAREKALRYAKGEVKDLPVLFNRSAAVSTDVADAIETVMPDLMEIFTGGDDVAVFQPQGPEDEDAARQETDYVNHVVFQDNSGFLALYTMIKDACTVKTGVAKYWWEQRKKTSQQKFQGQDQQTVAVVAQEGEIADLVQDPETGLIDFTLTRDESYGCLKLKAVPPEDFTVARDTVTLAETTYCAMRSRPRAQDLVLDGYDAKLVDQLPEYAEARDQEVEQARDTAGEHELKQASTSGLRSVEVVEHYIRIDGKLWRVLTGDNESILLEKEEAERIPFAAITPYIVPHRFYGLSLADKLVEVQRIKTAILRMFLDSGYFAQNQRYEVAESDMGEFTMSDLLRHEPGVPIRSKTGQAVRGIQAGSFDFPAMDALEYMSTVGEQRTGVVRNAQGLNPDTLHETAAGALALLGAAQKRVRMIARILAETGLKDLFVGIHAVLRENATKAATVRLRGQWTTVDPTAWGQRNDMTIELGVGAGGREHELAMAGQASAMLEKLVEMQGGPKGPIVTLSNIYNFAKRTFERGFGFKSADPYLTDPTQALQAEAANPQGPPPDPKMEEVNGKLAIAQQESAARLAMDQKKAESDAALERYKADQLHQRELQRHADEVALRRATSDAELALKERELATEADLRQRQIFADAVARARQPSETHLQNVEIGGEPG